MSTAPRVCVLGRSCYTRRTGRRFPPRSPRLGASPFQSRRNNRRRRNEKEQRGRGPRTTRMRRMGTGRRRRGESKVWNRTLPAPEYVRNAARMIVNDGECVRLAPWLFRSFVEDANAFASYRSGKRATAAGSNDEPVFVNKPGRVHARRARRREAALGRVLRTVREVRDGRRAGGGRRRRRRRTKTPGAGRQEGHRRRRLAADG